MIVATTRKEAISHEIPHQQRRESLHGDYREGTPPPDQQHSGPHGRPGFAEAIMEPSEEGALII